MKKIDHTMLRAVFTWHLIWDAAFLRSSMSFGYKTFAEVLADLKKEAPTSEHLLKWVKPHQMFDKKFTVKQLLDPKRWAIANADESHKGCVASLQDMLDQYEDWLWQLTHWFIGGKTDRKEPIFKKLRDALSWQVQCKSNHYHLGIELYDYDRLHKQALKLTPDDLRTRSIIAQMPVCVEDHPAYPDQLLGRLKDIDKTRTKNLKKTLADAKKRAKRKKR